MDFENLYKKSQKKVNQKEDYLTELIAFMANISDNLKEIYLKDFLKLKYVRKSPIRKPQFRISFKFGIL